MTTAAASYLIHSDPSRMSVETWTAWALPYDKHTPVQLQYRNELRAALMRLRAENSFTQHIHPDTLHAGPTSRTSSSTTCAPALFDPSRKTHFGSREGMPHRLKRPSRSTSRPGTMCDMK